MANVVPLDPTRHAQKGFQRGAGFRFAARQSVVPLGWSEFASAAPAMPIAFMQQGEHYLPVVLLGLAQASNLFVGPRGEWFGQYVPAMLRVYPLYLVRNEGSEQAILSVDEESGLIADASGENVEKFYESDGTLSATTNAILETLRRTEQDRTKADLAIAALAAAGVIKPWALTVRVGNQDVTVNGLYRIDEAALNALDDAAFSKLRKASAVVIAYGQLFSMGQVNLLVRLSLVPKTVAQAAQQSPGQAAPSDLLPL
jgi:hypothetical protein